MSDLDPVLIAKTLLAAYESGVPVDPLTDSHPELTLEDAIPDSKEN
jgi:2-keto-4-pentenoate hydratase